MVEKMKEVLKEFNPCLQFHKLDLRRLRVSSLFKKESDEKELESNLTLVADYLNTSLNCIKNNYNRHVKELKKALDLLQPITTEMSEAFETFKDINPTPLEDVNSRFKRYVRITLDASQHEKQYQEWMN